MSIFCVNSKHHVIRDFVSVFLYVRRSMWSGRETVNSKKKAVFSTILATDSRNGSSVGKTWKEGGWENIKIACNFWKCFKHANTFFQSLSYLIARCKLCFFDNFFRLFQDFLHFWKNVGQQTIEAFVVRNGKHRFDCHRLMLAHCL